MPSLQVDAVDPAVAALLNLFRPPVPRPAPGIHPSAVVADSAEIGEDTAIGPHVVIEDGARIGAGCLVYPGVHVGARTRVGAACTLWNHVVIRENCIVGDRVILHSHVVIGADGFGYYLADGRHKCFPHAGSVVINDDVEIGAGSTVDRAKVGETVIGRGTKIDNLVQIAHNVQIGESCLIAAQTGVAGSTVLEDGVILGGQVGLRDNIRLNSGSRVAACGCVGQDVPAGAVVGGIPAIEHRRFLRAASVVARLPELNREIRALAKRVRSLETANDQDTSGA